MIRTVAGSVVCLSSLLFLGCSSGGYVDPFAGGADGSLSRLDLFSVRDLGVAPDLRKTPRTELSFASAKSYPSSSTTFQVAVGKVDSDPYDDLVLSGHPIVNTFLSLADGSLQPMPQSLAANWQVAIADMNLDGKGDMLLTDTGNGAITVSLGNGDGSFRSAISVPAGKTPQGVASADLNSDGKPDLLAVDQSAAELYVYLGKGDGMVTFAQKQTTVMGGSPLWISTADINGDSWPDVVVANLSSANLSLFLGKGDGTLLPPKQISTISGPCDVEIADLDLDGRLDLAVNGEGPEHAVAVHLADGEGGFRPMVKYGYQDGSGQGIAISDLNADGWPDLVAVSAFSSPARVFLGAGSGVFLPERTFNGAGSNPFNVRAVDLNRDGKPDLVLSDGTSRMISVLLNTTPPPVM
jgi:hypothetical protein